MTRRAIAIALAATWTILLAATPASADSIRDQQWHLDALNITAVHKISQGEGVIVAVIDSGVDASHPDLAGSVLPGKDIVDPTNSDGRLDLYGHGTGMAGLIAAHGKALGIAPKAKILPIRNLSIEGSPQLSDRGELIDWAVDHGATVICIAQGEDVELESERAAVNQALRAGVVIVAAAGNRPIATAVGYPAAFPGVVAVGGTDKDGNHADVSVSGPEVVISAPAVDVLSTNTRHWGGNAYRVGVGTSDSTAIVAGAAALIQAKYPNLSAAEVVHRLTATADDKGPPGRDPDYGYGSLNILKALTADIPPLTTPPAPPQAQPPTTNTTTLAILGGILIIALLAGAATITALRRKA